MPKDDNIITVNLILEVKRPKNGFITVSYEQLKKSYDLFKMAITQGLANEKKEKPKKNWEVKIASPYKITLNKKVHEEFKKIFKERYSEEVQEPEASFTDETYKKPNCKKKKVSRRTKRRSNKHSKGRKSSRI